MNLLKRIAQDLQKDDSNFPDSPLDYDKLYNAYFCEEDEDYDENYYILANSLPEAKKIADIIQSEGRLMSISKLDEEQKSDVGPHGQSTLSSDQLRELFTDGYSCYDSGT